MLPWQIVERAAGPGGAEWALARRGDEWVVRADGRVLMSSRQHGSEEALAGLALARLTAARSRLSSARGRSAPASTTVLVGGLGLGFTLRAALDRLPPGARVVVAELVPALVAWNRTHLADLAGRPLEDPRARLQQGDVLARIAEAKGAFDAILLDVDNGPSPLAHAPNERLYGNRGVRACRDALRTGGVLAVWSAGPDEPYRERLERAGLEVEVKPVPARSGTSKGVRHVVFLGVKKDEGPARVAPSAPADRRERGAAEGRSGSRSGPPSPGRSRCGRARS
jgi:spermidine synthase